MKKLFILFLLFLSTTSYAVDPFEVEQWVDVLNTNKEYSVSCIPISKFRRKTEDGLKYLLLVIPIASTNKIPVIKDKMKKYLNRVDEFSNSDLQLFKSTLLDNGIKFFVLGNDRPLQKLIDFGGRQKNNKLNEGE